MSAAFLREGEAWRGARVAVVGLARSGVAACLFLRRRGAIVTATDRRREDELTTVAAELSAAGVSLVLGGHPDLTRFDAVILSPGVDPTLDLIVAARERGVRVLPELELGALAFRGRLVCVTGTKGKSTTTASLAAMLCEAGFDARAVGNIGEPITAHVDDTDERTILVAESSSFQLETTMDLHPEAAVFLNLFPDHLDRHPSFEAYGAAKARIFRNQTADDFAIVNAEDEHATAFAARGRARVLPFRPSTPLRADDKAPIAGFEGDLAISKNADGPVTEPRGDLVLFARRDVQVPGAAACGNLLAAAFTASTLGASTDGIRRAVRSFRGVPHTLERVGSWRDILFFNDSKATTIESVRTALESFDAPVRLILGGRLKAGSFADLRDAVTRHVAAIHAIGEARGLIVSALRASAPVHEEPSLEAAVENAAKAAKEGEIVLLSPGCASFDMFRDYAHRGETFRRAFERLSLEGAA